VLLGAAALPSQDSRPASAERTFATWAELESLVKHGSAGPDVIAKWKPTVESFVIAHAGSEDALAARLWLLQQTWWERQAGTMAASSKTLVEAILADHPKSRQLAKIAEYHYVFSPADRAEVLARLTTHEEPEVAAAATYQLGAREKKPELMRELVAKYKDLPFKHTTYGALAQAQLDKHPAKALAVGAQAPEILGADADGKPMKLSDHRGKVVVLDFWGFW